MGRFFLPLVAHGANGWTANLECTIVAHGILIKPQNGYQRVKDGT